MPLVVTSIVLLLAVPRPISWPSAETTTTAPDCTPATRNCNRCPDVLSAVVVLLPCVGFSKVMPVGAAGEMYKGTVWVS